MDHAGAMGSLQTRCNLRSVFERLRYGYAVSRNMLRKRLAFGTVPAPAWDKGEKRYPVQRYGLPSRPCVYDRSLPAAHLKNSAAGSRCSGRNRSTRHSRGSQIVRHGRLDVAEGGSDPIDGLGVEDLAGVEAEETATEGWCPCLIPGTRVFLFVAVRPLR